MAVYSTHTDQELVTLLQSGDERAFDQLFRKFYPALCYFAKRYVPAQELAEEVVQDVMVKLWQRHVDFESFNSLKAFLYISIKNGCLDSAISEKRKLNRDNNWYQQQEQLEADVEEYIIQTEVLMEISQAIAMLPDQCRNIMKMSYEQGMSGKQIAEAMQITVSTVNNQKARGILLLRKILSYKGMATLMIIVNSKMFE
ncbi:RNA polymerase sigma-70 factor [Pedobacter africanus]|uniref:RNA polymerase sigma-70 factor, ECF subfamily n=1 Tax=Pedobacter africanus TaxID=151894 RepID=A0A1W2CTH2_9SPHI|nr:RNA polymerase sigma-70 factor [Pedobacter africanus]SMC88529.1 RNA polymerase sigma-70 factor, ECF subfamily [Pedobacter africanus]